MHLMKRMILLLAACLLLLCPCAAQGEGDPLLSVDDLALLEESYAAFLSELESLIISRGMLSENERQAWRDAQMGDFYQNGGYGSILANYTPGVLSYARAEETTASLSAVLPGEETLSLLTMRRYTPRDSSLSGLMLTMDLTGADGLPMDVSYSLSATSGLFLKWDPVTGSYASIGTTALSEGETVVWSDQTPIEGANDPVITVVITDALTLGDLGKAQLTLRVDGEGYQIHDGALTAAP